MDENVESAAKLRCKFESLDDLDDSIDNALEVTGMEGIADRDVKILSGDRSGAWRWPWNWCPIPGS